MGERKKNISFQSFHLLFRRYLWDSAKHDRPVPMELCKKKRKQNNKKQVLMLIIKVLFHESLYVWDVYGMPSWINHPKFVCNVKVLNFRINRLIIYNQLSLLNVLEGPSCIMCSLFMYNWNTFYSFFYGSGIVWKFATTA